MVNIIKGDSLNVNTLYGIKKVVFSHYSDKWHKRFFALDGLEYNYKDIVIL